MADANNLVLERTLDAPRDRVWQAWTDPERLKTWFAPKPYLVTEAEIELKPGGRFHTRMIGPEDFDSASTGCVLEIVEGRKLVWTSSLGPGFRPAALPDDGCEALAMTVIMTLDDAGDGRTLYRAVALHKDEADRDAHAAMGFHEGWGKCADQLEQVAKEAEAVG